MLAATFSSWSLFNSVFCVIARNYLLLCRVFIFLTELVCFKWFSLMLYISTGAGHLLLYVYICIFSLLFVSILMKFLLCNLVLRVCNFKCNF